MNYRECLISVLLPRKTSKFDLFMKEKDDENNSRRSFSAFFLFPLDKFPPELIIYSQNVHSSVLTSAAQGEIDKLFN